MTLAISTLGILAIVGGCWLLLIALFLALFHTASKDFDPQDRERLGLLEQDAAERQVRIERAVARHGDRRGRSA